MCPQSAIPRAKKTKRNTASNGCPFASQTKPSAAAARTAPAAFSPIQTARVRFIARSSPSSTGPLAKYLNEDAHPIAGWIMAAIRWSHRSRNSVGPWRRVGRAGTEFRTNAAGTGTGEVGRSAPGDRRRAGGLPRRAVRPGSRVRLRRHCGVSRSCKPGRPIQSASAPWARTPAGACQARLCVPATPPAPRRCSPGAAPRSTFPGGPRACAPRRPGPSPSAETRRPSGAPPLRRSIAGTPAGRSGRPSRSGCP